MQSGALCPIDTIQTVIEDGGVRFLVREVSSLRRKDEARKVPSTANAGNAAGNASGNPFLPYDAELFVTDISDGHVALLNKFNVIDHHLLIVTRCFESQESLLTVPDFAALLACMAEFPCLGFYNGGAAAGSSQPHKHLQLVPLPLAEGSPSLPIDTLLLQARSSGAPGTIRAVPGFRFAHAYAPLDLTAAPPHALAGTACERYRALLDSVGIRALQAGGTLLQSAPYNLLVMPGGLLLVRRARECVEGISLNALAFAGSLFVRDAAQRRAVERLGPMRLLRRAAAHDEPGGQV